MGNIQISLPMKRQKTGCDWGAFLIQRENTGGHFYTGLGWMGRGDDCIQQTLLGKLLKNYLFIYLCLYFVLVAAQAFLQLRRVGATLQLWCAGFSKQCLLLSWSTGSRAARASVVAAHELSMQLLDSRAQSQQLWHTGLVASRHVGSSQPRDRTHVSCLGRQILYH